MAPRLSQELAHVLVLHRIAPGRSGRRYAFDVLGTGEGRGRAAPPPTGRVRRQGRRHADRAARHEGVVRPPPLMQLRSQDQRDRQIPRWIPRRGPHGRGRQADAYRAQDDEARPSSSSAQTRDNEQGASTPRGDESLSHAGSLMEPVDVQGPRGDLRGDRTCRVRTRSSGWPCRSPDSAQRRAGPAPLPSGPRSPPRVPADNRVAPDARASVRFLARNALSRS